MKFLLFLGLFFLMLSSFGFSLSMTGLQCYNGSCDNFEEPCSHNCSTTEYSALDAEQTYYSQFVHQQEEPSFTQFFLFSGIVILLLIFFFYWVHISH